MLSKGFIVGLIVILVAFISAYTILEVLHDAGTDILAIGISSLVSVFVLAQNQLIAKDLERVRNQTNGITHHVMQENRELRRAVIQNEEGNPEDVHR